MEIKDGYGRGVKELKIKVMRKEVISEGTNGNIWNRYIITGVIDNTSQRVMVSYDFSSFNDHIAVQLGCIAEKDVVVIRIERVKMEEILMGKTIESYRLSDGSRTFDGNAVESIEIIYSY